MSAKALTGICTLYILHMDALGEDQSKSGGDDGRRKISEAPPRPGWSTRSAPPIGKLAPEPPPGIMRLAQFFWVVSFLVGTSCIFIVYLVRDRQLEWLRELVREMSLNIEPESLDSVTGLVFWVSLGAVSLVILIEVVFVSVLMLARNWARWALVVVLLLHLGVAVLAGALLIPPGDTGTYVLAFLAVEFGLALAGVVLSFLPRASAWIKSRSSTG